MLRPDRESRCHHRARGRRRGPQGAAGGLRTPLHVAAGSAVITALVDAGADACCPGRRRGPQGAGENGATPLHFAAGSTENPAVITALLDAGADPKARAENGVTPWDLAKDREPLKGSDAYWRLNEARF